MLVLISIMTAMIVPEMRGTYGEALLRSSSRTLVNVLDLAYSRAVTINQPHRVRFDINTGRYLIERRVREAAGEMGFAPVRGFPGTEGQLDRRISIEVRKPVEAFSDGSDPGLPSKPGDDSPSSAHETVLAFYPDGTADDREIILSDRDGFRLRLRVNPTTARVRIIEMERK